MEYGLYKDVGSIVSSIGQSLKADNLRRFLRYFPNPYLPHQRYIEPSIYEGAEGTGDILDRLHPEYINPENTYLLEEIVRKSHSRQCKRLLEEYTKKCSDKTKPWHMCQGCGSHFMYVCVGVGVCLFLFNFIQFTTNFCP